MSALWARDGGLPPSAWAIVVSSSRSLRSRTERSRVELHAHRASPHLLSGRPVAAGYGGASRTGCGGRPAGRRATPPAGEGRSEAVDQPHRCSGPPPRNEVAAARHPTAANAGDTSEQPVSGPARRAIPPARRRPRRRHDGRGGQPVAAMPAQRASRRPSSSWPGTGRSPRWRPRCRCRPGRRRRESTSRYGTGVGRVGLAARPAWRGRAAAAAATGRGRRGRRPGRRGCGGPSSRGRAPSRRRRRRGRPRRWPRRGRRTGRRRRPACAARRRACPRSRCRTSRWRPGTSTTSHVGEHAEAADEVDGGDERRPRRPVAARERRQLRLGALAPQPHLVGGEARSAPTTSAAASISRVRRGGGRPGRPARPACRRGRGAACTRRRPTLGGHHDVAVLHAGVELDLARRPPSSASRAAITSAASSVDGWPPAKSTIVPSSPTVDEVAAVGDLVGPQAQAEGGGLDRRPAGVVAAPGRSRGSTCCRRRCPAACPGGITAARPTSPRAARRGQRRHRRRLERRAPAELVDRLVGAAVGHADHVLHGRSLAGGRPGLDIHPVPCHRSRRARSGRRAAARSTVARQVSTQRCRGASPAATEPTAPARGVRACRRSPTTPAATGAPVAAVVGAEPAVLSRRAQAPRSSARSWREAASAGLELAGSSSSPASPLG